MGDDASGVEAQTDAGVRDLCIWHDLYIWVGFGVRRLSCIHRRDVLEILACMHYRRTILENAVILTSDWTEWYDTT